MRSSTLLSILTMTVFACVSPSARQAGSENYFRAEHDTQAGIISVYGANGVDPVLVQHAAPGIRPYIHPIIAPDGKGELTEFSPHHHKHQTGLYWGLKRVNGERDYFMNWKEDYWRRRAVDVLQDAGAEVQWQTVYDLLDENAEAILTETQNWTFRQEHDRFILDLRWSGKALTDITMGKFYVGGLFLRMPWREGIDGEVVNADGRRNEEAEGKRSIWTDVGITVPGRADRAHIAILDHPGNKGFPVAWRVDNELGVGPSRQITGDWRIEKGQTEVFRYRLIAYTGPLDSLMISDVWKSYASETTNN